MAEVSLSQEKMIDMYRKMWLGRYHELRVEEMKTKGQILGSMHLAIGQEAVAVGTCAALNDDDYTMHTHREHQQLIAKGADIKKMAGDMCGKVTGCCRGKGGHMMLFDKDVNALGACGIVGGGVPVAVGYAMAFKTLGTKQVALAFFGDGAANEGSVHEAMNFAAVKKYPVVFLCENNRWGLTVPQHEQAAVADLADRARGYGIPGVTVNGNDVLAVYEAVKLAVERARSGDGPSMVECQTWRMRGMGFGDPGDYMPKEFFEEGAKQDPIEMFEKKLLEKKILSVEEARKIESDAKKFIDDVYDEAMNAPDPDESVFWANVYAAEI